MQILYRVIYRVMATIDFFINDYFDSKGDSDYFPRKLLLTEFLFNILIIHDTFIKMSHCKN